MYEKVAAMGEEQKGDEEKSRTADIMSFILGAPSLQQTVVLATGHNISGGTGHQVLGGRKVQCWRRLLGN